MLDDILNPTLDAIDLAAEREARALEWMQEQLDIEMPLPLFQKRQQIPLTKNCRFPLAASLRVNDRLHKATVPQLVNWKSKKEVCTKQDRARREVRQVRRKALLKQLQTIPAPYVPFPQALSLVDAGARTIQRAVAERRIEVIHQGRRVLVAVASLKQYLASKVA